MTSVNIDVESTTVNPLLWIAVVTAICLFSAILGYIISNETGVEPGFFERPEAGGYGVTADGSSNPDLDKNLQDYYNDLSQ